MGKRERDSSSCQPVSALNMFQETWREAGCVAEREKCVSPTNICCFSEAFEALSVSGYSPNVCLSYLTAPSLSSHCQRLVPGQHHQTSNPAEIPGYGDVPVHERVKNGTNQTMPNSR